MGFIEDLQNIPKVSQGKGGWGGKVKRTLSSISRAFHKQQSEKQVDSHVHRKLKTYAFLQKLDGATIGIADVIVQLPRENVKYQITTILKNNRSD